MGLALETWWLGTEWLRLKLRRALDARMMAAHPPRWGFADALAARVRLGLALAAIAAWGALQVAFFANVLCHPLAPPEPSPPICTFGFDWMPDRHPSGEVQRPATLTIQSTPPAHAELLRGGLVIGACPAPCQLAVSPGARVTLRLAAAGWRTWSRSFRVPGDQRFAVSLRPARGDFAR